MNDEDPTNRPAERTGAVGAPKVANAGDNGRYLNAMLLLAPFAGAAYGLGMRVLSGRLREFAQVLGISDQVAGTMSLGFLLLTPVAIGMITVYLLRRPRVGWLAAIFMPWVATILMMVGAMVTLLEGAICVFIIAPFFLALASLGGVAMKLLLGWAKVRGGHVACVALLPLLALPVDGPLMPTDGWRRIDRSVVVAARPERIWAEIVGARAIQAGEMPPTLIHLIGVPRPMEGINRTTPAGEVRESRWERGVHFRGRITERVLHRRIAWRYEFEPDSFPPGTMDEHVVIGGRYFDLGETRFVLTPLDDGRTRLDVEAHYRVTSSVNLYAVPVAELLGRDFVDSLLTLYKARSERPASGLAYLGNAAR